MVKGFKVKNKGVAIYAKNNDENYIVDNPIVIFDDGIYKMWFSDHENLYLSISSDGKNWEERIKIEGLNKYITTFTVIKTDNKFYMWHIAVDDNINEVAKTYLATSEDGVEWDIDGPVNGLGNVILNYGSMYPVNLSVVKKGTTFYMWYTNNIFDDTTTILFTSEDGISWEFISTANGFKPVNGYIFPLTPTVIVDGEQFMMYFTSSIDNIVIGNICKSNNGVEWEFNSHAVLEYDQDSGVVGVHNPTVIKDSEGYKLWYAARHYHGDWTIEYIMLN